MRTSLLVLVRWQGDIIATHNVEQGRSVQSFDFLEGFASDADVRVEVHDVTAERVALGKRLTPSVDLRAAYALMVSGSLHLGLVVVALLTLLGQSHRGERLEVDDPNRRASMTEDPIAHVAASEGADAGVLEPAKEEAQPIADEPSADLGLTSQPEPGEPGPAEPLGEPVEQEGSASPGSGGTDEVTASAATCTATRPPKNTGKVCHRTVVVRSLTIPPGCFTDTVMKLGETGTLTFPCEGDGEARLTFGRKSFSGASLGGKLEMCAGTEYPFSDGCRWTSAQRVRGRLGMGALDFEYGEAPKAGQNKRCARACSASGSVDVK